MSYTSYTCTSFYHSDLYSFCKRLSTKFYKIFKGFKLNKGSILCHCQRAMLEGSFFQSCDKREPLLYSST